MMTQACDFFSLRFFRIRCRSAMSRRWWWLTGQLDRTETEQVSERSTQHTWTEMRAANRAEDPTESLLQLISEKFPRKNEFSSIINHSRMMKNFLGIDVSSDLRESAIEYSWSINDGERKKILRNRNHLTILLSRRLMQTLILLSLVIVLCVYGEPLRPGDFDRHDENDDLLVIPHALANNYLRKSFLLVHEQRFSLPFQSVFVKEIFSKPRYHPTSHRNEPNESTGKTFRFTPRITIRKRKKSNRCCFHHSNKE